MHNRENKPRKEVSFDLSELLGWAFLNMVKGSDRRVEFKDSEQKRVERDEGLGRFDSNHDGSYVLCAAVSTLSWRNEKC